MDDDAYDEKLKVCLTALDRMDTGKTILDGNFLKLCEVLLFSARTMQEEESRYETMQENSAAESKKLLRCTYDCLRISIILEAQLFKFKSDANTADVNPAQVDILLKQTEKMFASMIVSIHSGIATEGFDELLNLGEVCSLLCAQVAQYGPKVLNGCHISLPIANVEALEPPKVIVRVNDLNSLFAVQSLWASAVCTVLSTNPSSQEVALLIKPLYQQVASLTLGRGVGRGTPHVIIWRLCTALAQLNSMIEVSDMQSRTDAIDGLLLCIQEYLMNALAGASAESSRSDVYLFSLISNTFEKQGRMHEIKMAISAAFSALTKLLWSGYCRKHNGGSGIGDSSQLALNLIRLLSLVIPSRAELSMPFLSARTKQSSKENAKDHQNAELYKEIVSFVTTHLLSSLRHVIQDDFRCCPNVFFLTQCSFDVPTQAAAISCELVAVRLSGDAAAILRWAEGSGNNLAITTGDATAKSSKKTSFAQDVVAGGAIKGGSTDTKRRRVSEQAIVAETPMVIDSLPRPRGSESRHTSSSNKVRVMPYSSSSSSSSSSSEISYLAAKDSSMLTELQSLFFVLQELMAKSSAVKASSDVSMRKHVIASILFETICAVKSWCGKSSLDTKDDSGAPESIVFSSYLECHHEIVESFKLEKGATECAVTKVQEYPSKKSKIAVTVKSNPPAASSNTLVDPMPERLRYLWATIVSLCRVFSVSTISVTPNLAAALQKLMTSAISVALPSSLQSCAEKEATSVLSIPSLSIFLPGVPFSQFWLRDIFHKEKYSSHALTRNLRTKLSQNDISMAMYKNLDAFDECLQMEDFSSLCFSLSTFPIAPTTRRSHDHSFRMIEQHIHALDECRRYYLSAFAAKHVQHSLVGQLIHSSQNVDFDRASLDSSVRLVSDYFKFIFRVLDAPIGQGVVHLTRDPCSIKVLFDSLTGVVTTIGSLLLKSFQPELFALKKCMAYSIPLMVAFGKDKSSDLSAVDSLVHVQLLKQADLWIKVNKICPDNGFPSDCELQASSNDTEFSTHPSAVLGAIIAPALAQLWNSLKSKVVLVVKAADEMQGHSNSATGHATDDSAGYSEKNDNEGSNEKYWTRQATTGCSMLDFLVHFRSAIGSVHACLCDDERDHASLKSSLISIGIDIDEQVNFLLHSGIVDFHPIQARLSLLVSISMLDYSFQEGLLHPEDHRISNFGRHGSSKSWLLGSQLVKPSVGGRFGALLQEDVTSMTTMKTQRDVNRDKDRHIEKRRNDRQSVALSAFSSFLEHNILINPAASIWALSSMIELWSDNDFNSPASRMCFEELSHIAGKDQLLKYLLVTNCELVVEWIILPLVMRDMSGHLVSSILNTLTVSFFGWAAPVNPKESYDDANPTPESAHDTKNKSLKAATVFRPEQFVLFVGDLILSGLASCHDNARTRAARVRMASLAPIYNQVGNSITRSFIDEKPRLLYRILVSPTVQDMEESDLVRSGLKDYLEKCASQLDMPVQAEREAADTDIIVVTTMHHVLLHLVWDLGSSERAHRRALKALKVMATIFNSKKWHVSSSKNRSDMNVTDLEEHVANLLSNSFLYIMSNLLQFNWNKQTQNQQEQSIRALRCVVCLLKQSDLTKFLPTIMTVVDTVLGSLSQRVRHAGVELTAELCNRLPHDVLCESLSALVVGLFPIVEGEASESGNSSNQSESIELALIDLQRLGKMFTPDFKVHEPALYHSKNSIGLSKDVTLILEASFAQEASKKWAEKAKATAIQIIKTLFLTRRRDISRGIQSVAYIPANPELESVRSLHAQEQQSLGLVDTLKLLIKMLKHDTVHVRAMALDRLLDVCRENKTALYDIIKSSAVNAAYIVGSGKQDIVSFLLQELLMLTAREREQLAIDACAKCIGELGAIDPALVTVDVLTSSKTLTNTVTVSGAQPVSISLSSDLNCTPPWEVSGVQLGLFLLVHHLVPDMKSSTAGQDRTGFAIQQVLSLLWSELQSQSNQQSRRGHVATSRDPGGMKKVEDKGPMPELLADILQQLNIHDVTAPYWNTKYRIQDTGILPSPIYEIDMQFQLWLSKWAKQMLAMSGGRNHGFIDACRGVFKTRPALSQFVLPSVLVGQLMHPNAASCIHGSAQQTLVQEICHVLKGGESAVELDFSSHLATFSTDPMAVQAVFSLLDILSNWASKGMAARPRRTGTAPSSISVGSTANQTHDSVDEDVYPNAVSAGRSIRELLEAIPKMLLCSAALSIKAYARALRYLELHLRQLRLNEKDKVSLGLSAHVRPVQASSSNSSSSSSSSRPSRLDTLTRPHHDGSNGELPPLESNQIDIMMQIFSKLEDPDALQGLLLAAQKQGTPPSTENRILEMEQSDDWLGALLEYGLMQSGPILSASKIPQGGGDKVLAQCLSTTATPVGNATLLNVGRGSTSRGNEGLADDSEIEMAIADDNVDDSCRKLGIQERGRLKCLLELGHLEAVVDQALGAIQRDSQLEPLLLPLGVEASWRLMQWDNLETWLKKADHAAGNEDDEMVSGEEGGGTFADPLASLAEDSFSLSVGRLMLELRRHDRSEFQNELLKARRSTMKALSAASMESYRRAYPLIARLQVLQELEEGFELVATRNTSLFETEEVAKNRLLSDKWHWEERLESMSPGLAQRSFVLAVRRTLLGASGLKKLVAKNLLSLADRLGGLGRYDAARIALQQAGRAGLEYHESVLQEALFLKESGQVHKALALLEPVEPDCPKIRSILKNMKSVNVMSEMPFAVAKNSSERAVSIAGLAQIGMELPDFLSCKENKHAFSERLLLGTQLMIESRAKHGAHIVDRFKCLTDLRVRWAQAHFHYARYYEYLYHDFKRKDILDLQTAAAAASNTNPTARPSVILRGVSKPATAGGDDNHTFMCRNAVFALKEYCKSIAYGLDESELMQALPRMLTLWFSFTNPEVRATGKPTDQAKHRSEMAQRARIEASGLVKKYQDQIKSDVWFACMPQLVSRTGHRNPETLEIVKSIILRVLITYPQQSIWHIAGLIHSLVPARKEIGERLINESYAELKKKLDQHSSSLQAQRADSAEMLKDSKKLFINLVELAAHQHKDKRLKWIWPAGIDFKRFLVPNQHVLARVSPHIEFRRGAGDLGVSSNSNAHNTFQYISSFNETVDVAGSKAKPKTIYLTTTSGAAVKFLCKQEKNGDLRKDVRMMEFNTVINRLLQHDLEGRRRNLRLRTYAVVCLNEECGILEWVGNTTCIRHLIQQAHMYHPQCFPIINTKEIYHPFIEMQEKLQDDLAGMVREYRTLILDNYRPCFHRWFIETFSDPTAWLEARVTFTRSCAVWAAVGHVIGLGDRHTENILIDTTNGECVHVDFDCLFDKGLQLARPEIVPFRLTPNMIDAMGLTGVEGTFRQTMEVCFYLLRDNKETLLSVLEPFLRDPTVAWGRGGRAQRPELQPGGGGKAGAAATFLGKSAADVGGLDNENPEVKEALEKITGRLNGIYNLTNPAQERILRAYQQRGQPAPIFGTGAGRDELHSLSVQGQVARLMDEAKAEENLSQMYVGWQPWC